MTTLCLLQNNRLNIADVIAIVAASIAFLALIATVIGLIVTQYHFTKNMKKQEQAIAISMLDKRLDVLHYFEHEKDSTDDVIENLLYGTTTMLELFRLLFNDKLIKEYDSIQTFKKNQIEPIRKSLLDLENKYLAPKTNATQNEIQTQLHNKAELHKAQTNATNPGATLSQRNDFRAIASKLMGNTDDYYDLTMEFIQLNVDLKQKEEDFKKHLKEEIRNSINA